MPVYLPLFRRLDGSSRGRRKSVGRLSTRWQQPSHTTGDDQTELALTLETVQAVAGVKKTEVGEALVAAAEQGFAGEWAPVQLLPSSLACCCLRRPYPCHAPFLGPEDRFSVPVPPQVYYWRLPMNIGTPVWISVIFRYGSPIKR